MNLLFFKFWRLASWSCGCQCLITQEYSQRTDFFSIPPCKPVPPGSVPSGPSGAAFGPGLGHHAPHRRLHRLRVHRRRQGPTDASRQRQRIAMGEGGDLTGRWYWLKICWKWNDLWFSCLEWWTWPAIFPKNPPFWLKQRHFYLLLDSLTLTFSIKLSGWGWRNGQLPSK